jgi:hypothetical protein
MMNSINYFLLSSDELSTFASRSIATVDVKKSQIPAVVPFLSIANQSLLAFRSALERESKNPFIKIQNEMDHVRNAAFMSFRSGCESAASRTKEGFKAAGNTLLDVIIKQGWSAQALGMKVKSSVLRSIISEIRGKHAAELALTGLAESLDELETAQNNFEMTAQQTVDAASANIEPTVAETRPKLAHSLRSLFQIITLQEISAPSADVTVLIASLNELITVSMTTVKASSTRAENKKKTDENKITTLPVN